MATTMCSVLTVAASTANPAIDRIDVYRAGSNTPTTTIYTNEAVDVCVWLSNTGNTAVTGTLTLKVGSTQIGSQSNVTIPANTPVGQGYIEFESRVLATTAGTYTLTATFTHPGGTLTKTSTITVTVPTAKMAITSVALYKYGTTTPVDRVNTGEYVDFWVNLVNNGTTDVTYQIYMLRDGVEMLHTDPITTAAGATKTFKFMHCFNSSTAGIFEFCAYVRESNGATTASTCKPLIVVEPQVYNVEVTSVSLQSTSGIAGAPNVVSYTIKNTGTSTAPANSYKIKITVGSTVLEEYTYPVALAPNEWSSFTYNFNNPSTAGNYNVCVDAIKL